MMPYALAALLAAQAVLLALDAWDLGWRRCPGGGSQRWRPSVRVVGFLVVVSLLYLAIQLLGGCHAHGVHLAAGAGLSGIITIAHG
jgi:hypothetical protein